MKTTVRSGRLAGLAVAIALVLGVGAALAPRTPAKVRRSASAGLAEDAARFYATAAPAPAPRPSADPDRLYRMSMRALSAFDYRPMGPPARGQPAGSRISDTMPDSIRNLDGHRVAITGFMLPMQMEKQYVRTFMLMSFIPSCCFGDAGRVNDWVEVQVAPGARVAWEADGMVEATGRLSVAEYYMDREVAGVYRMVADAVVRSNR